MKIIEKILGTAEQKKFIDGVGRIASIDMVQSGVPASLTIAQAILESNWGKSGLTVNANALFGIKTGSSWKGKAYNAATQECFDGVSMTTITALFRAYNSWEESIADHSALLTGLERYKDVIGEKDYRKACVTIQKAGYATDPAYSKKLIDMIEAYRLYEYDNVLIAGQSNTEGVIAMTEKEYRSKVVSIAKSFYGCKESDGSHRKIIDTYNANKPLARNYAMTYTDAWCACFVSVVAIKAGLLDIMPKEVSCIQMIELYKKLGRWQENDAYIPQPGDVIFYDWQDSGTGDNVGVSDHVGIVVSVSGNMIKVIEGNLSKAVGYRDIVVNGKLIRGYGLPDYASKVHVQGQTQAQAQVQTQDKKEIRYDKVEDMPEWGKATMQKLIDKGFISGRGGGHLDISDDMLRILVVVTRLTGV